jgi:adenylate cyclase class IV
LLDAKFLCGDLTELARRVEAHQGRYVSSIRQTDTYYLTHAGTLKLRESATEHSATPQEPLAAATLVGYWRDTRSGHPTCTYYLSDVGDPAACRASLAATLGVRVVVRKLRQVWILHSSRVHLDDVQGVGQFAEIETPYDAGQATFDRCRAALGLSDTPPLTRWYAELAESASSAADTRGHASTQRIR